MVDFLKVVTPYIYINASTDTKPAAASIGSLCYETDTGAWYVTADGSTWTLYKGDTRWLLS